LAPKLNRELGFLLKGGASSLAHPALTIKAKTSKSLFEEISSGRSGSLAHDAIQ
jgi:hypothetical protein